jgi:hypothetical protein
MPGDLEYAHEKYSSAVSILATTEGTLKERFVDAIGTQALQVDPLQDGQGPAMSEELASRMAFFQERLTVGTSGEAANVQENVDSLSAQDLQQSAQELLEIGRMIDLELQAAIEA